MTTATGAGAVDQLAYQQRAANAPMPTTHLADVAQHLPNAEALNEHDPELALWLATTAANYFADISEYQQPFNSQYAYPIRMFRCHTGYRRDLNAAANWANTEQSLNAGTTRIAFTYPVFVPGQFNVMMNDLKNLFGSQCPTPRLVPVLDMESGAGFAGPGNHSAEANEWVTALADYANTPDFARSHGYANISDFQSCWPQIIPAIPKHTANYNAVNPNTLAWQYQGGNPTYPAPAGAPRSYAPFGTYVDGNVIYQTLDTIEQILGITKQGVFDVTERIIALGNNYYRYAAGMYRVSIPNAPGGTSPSSAQLALIFSAPECITKNAGLYPDGADAVTNGGIEVCDQAHFDLYTATLPVAAPVTLTPADITALAAAIPAAPKTLTISGPIEGTLT